MKQKTFLPKALKAENRKWYLVDADGQVLGRMAAKIAAVLRGKHNKEFTPHVDVGDYVVVINAAKVKLTGNKEEQKTYSTHTAYRGHIRKMPAKEVRVHKPARMIEEAVAGMIPRNHTADIILGRLYVHAGTEHSHTGQAKNLIPLSF